MGARGAAGSLSGLREANTRRVLDVLRQQGTATQAEIARATGLSPATVSNIVGELRARRVVQTGPGAGDRRALEVSLDPTAGVVIGVDFGNRHRRIAVSDLRHQVLAEDYRQLAPGHRLDDGVPDTVKEIDRLLGGIVKRRGDVRAVAIGLPAPIDPATGFLGSPGILPGWAVVDIQDAFQTAIGFPVAVDNDANLGALGEMHWGAGRGVTDFTYIKASMGIGAGLILGGTLYRGAAGTAGEIGHTTIDENGPVCRCGSRGCLELIAGIPALLELLRHSHPEGLTVRDLIALCEAGDAGCQRVIADAGRHIGVALANLCNLLSPRRIVVGGELAAAGEALLGPLRESMARRTVSAAADRVEVVLGTLAERASVLGAVALALQESVPRLGIS